MFGNSPIIEAIILPLLVALIVKVWTMGGDIAFVRAKLENFEKQFSALAKDFKESIKASSKLEHQIIILDKELKAHLKNHN